MAKKKYTSYQPSKTLWQQEIPSHWQETDLRMVFSENKERNTGLIERNLLSLSYGKLKRKDIDNATGLVPASFEGYQIIGKGYIVLRFTDLQNDKKSLRVGYCPERGIITNAYVAIAPKENTFSKYYYYQLHFLDTIKYFYNLGGGVRQSLSYKEFGRETVIVPEPEEQLKIAAFLDYKLAKIDRFIRKKKELIELLNEQKAAIINQAVTKGLDPHVRTKPSGVEWLGDIPENWEVKKFWLIIKRADLGGNYNSAEIDDGIPLMKMGNLGRGEIKLNKIEYIKSDDSYNETHILKYDDFLFNTRNSADLVGKVCLWKDELPFALYNSNILKIEFKAGILNEYMNNLFNSKSIINALRLISKGTTNVSAIYYKNLSKLEICMPNSIDEQIEINEFIENESSTLRKTVSTIEKEIALTLEYKTALIAEAVTGKIDVRDFEIPKTQDEETYEDLEEELSLAAEGEAEYENEEIEE